MTHDHPREAYIVTTWISTTSGRAVPDCRRLIVPRPERQRMFPFAHGDGPPLWWPVFLIVNWIRRRTVGRLTAGTAEWREAIARGWTTGVAYDHPDQFVDFAASHAGGIFASERRAADNLAAAIATFHDPDR